MRATRRAFRPPRYPLNNAGINTSLLRPEGQPVGKFWEVTPTEFRRVIDVNVVAVFLMTRAALPVMLKQRWGRIINVTTSLDTMYRAKMQPYGGSKAANEAHLLAHGAGARGHRRQRQRAGAGRRRQYAPGVARDSSPTARS